MTSEGELLFSDKQKNYISDQEINDILESLGDDLMLKQSLNKNMHLEKLDVVLQKCGPANIFKFLEKCSNPEIKPLVLGRLRTLATMSVKDASVNAIDMFNMGAEGLNEEHVVNILSEAFGNLPTDILKKLLCDVIIPEMFNNNNFKKKIHDIIIDVGFQLIEKFPITNLSNQEIKLYTTEVIDKYSKILENLREQNYSRWHDLWIFFVRFSAKHLHVAMDLANKLLRVVEYAFRNPSYEQRLKGYDCWKELIDNASLDVNHLCSNKQIKLLVTPLRAKFSKMEIVICKRFEVFLYLLEKLQRQSVLCLNEFLEFCFGVSNNVSNASKNGQGKLVPNLWLKSIQVFLAILGDQTHISSALNRTLFERPVIDANNINKFGYVTVCAVIECSIILKQISIESQEKIVILSSLWEALFDIIVKSTTEIQEKCFQTIFDYLSTVFKEFNEDVTYIGLYAAFTQLLESSIDQRLISDSLKLLLEYSLKFLCETDVSYEFSQQFCELIQIACKEIHLIEFLLEQFKKLEASKNESKLYIVWNILGTKLIEDSNITNNVKMVVQFFLWPVNNLQKFSTQATIDTCSTWLKLFVIASQRLDSIKTTILDEYEKCLKSNPLLSCNVATLISIIANAKMEFSREFVNKILKLILSIMSFPLLPHETSEKMYDLVLKCTNAVATFSEDDVDSEIVNNISQCIEKIRSHQKNLHLVEVLEDILNKKIIPQSSSSVEKRKKTSLVILSPQDSSNGSPSGTLKRSLRMTQMAVEKTSMNANNKDKVNALQFFGKDIDTMTPLKVKGSILQNQRSSSPISRSRKIINSVKKTLVPEPPAIEDQTCDYVIIDTEVKLQRDKLTEHQIEELKRRREDIPALYQDLSQSQTQSLSSSSKDNIPSNLPKVELNMPEKDVPCSEQLTNESSDIMEHQEMNKNSVDDISDIKVSNEGNFASVTKLEELDLNTESNDTETVNKKNNRKSIGKIQKELQKIQMNIVGGDTFLKNLPSKRPRKISTHVTPKRVKRTEQDPRINEEQSNEKQTDNPVSDNERGKRMNKKSDEVTSTEFQVQMEKITFLPKTDPVTNIAKLADDSPEKGLDGTTDSDFHSNNRKNKFIKPKKHIQTPRSNKKKSKLETPISSRKIKFEEMKTKNFKSNKTKRTTDISTEKNVSEETQSEIMFESEIDTENKKKTGKVEHSEIPNKSEKSCFSAMCDQQNDSSFESGNISMKKENEDKKNNIQKINIEKYKKLPKEIMKRNKEKVRKIQSQLKLANLSDLTDSSEPKKTKGAKLIIREITKSKHVEDTKVTPTDLKNNKDKKSSNIAYSIEPPVASVDLVSLDLGVVQSSLKESRLDEVSFEAEREKPTRKRKNSVISISSSSASENSPIEKEKNINRKTKLKRKTAKENSVSDISCIKPPDSPKIQPPELKTNKPSSLKTNSKFLESSKSVEVKRISSTKKNSPLKIPSITTLSPESPSRVTRSRALSLSPLEPIIGSGKHNNSRSEPTKAVKSLFTESEDIIESSQDSLLENTTTSTGNFSRSRNKQSPKTHNISMKRESIEDEIHKKADIAVLSAEAVMVNTDGNNATSVDKKIESEFISQADTLTCESNCEPEPIVVNMDLPEKPELTDSEKILSTTDTVSIVSQTSEDREEEINTLGLDISGNNEIGVLEDVEQIDTAENSTKIIEAGSNDPSPEDALVGTPEAIRSRDMPGSPVSNATPTLIKELLDNTLDISPISSRIPSEEEKKYEEDIIKDLDEAIGLVEDPPEGARASSPVNDNKSDKSQVSLNLRSNKLLNMVNVASPVSRSKMSKKIILSPAPVNSRYEKLFSFFTGSTKEDENKMDKKKDDLITCTENVENILTFSREVPSPLALPTSSILKRKLTDIDDRFSPCAKRKRVNFSYPCISTTKLYIRHKEELNSHFRPSFSQNLFGDDYEGEDSVEEDPFANPDVEPIGSEESMDITNSLLLCRKNPIYEQLATCNESIDKLWKRLSSPTYSELLKRILISKNITTIGDLASLNEVQINRLPFKQPRIKTVRKALNFYFTNVYKKSEEDREANVQDRATCSADSENENQESGNMEEILETVAEETTETERPVELADLRDEFANILMKIKNEKMPLEEFGAALLDLVDETDLIGVLKSVYNTDFRKFFNKSDWRFLMENIVQSGGTTEMFDIISDLADNNETFAGQLESIVQLRIEKNPLKDIISRRTLTELKVAFEDCIDHNVFKREEVLRTCFMPLIKSPSDIKTYFNHLTIVQVHELFIERVQPSDLSLFLEQIREHYGNYTIAECANKTDVLKICSKEELMSSLIEKENEVQSVIELIGKISDQNKLVILYDFIGTLIPPETRREKFVEFLNSIPLSSKNVESSMK